MLTTIVRAATKGNLIGKQSCQNKYPFIILESKARDVYMVCKIDDPTTTLNIYFRGITRPPLMYYSV